MAMNIKVVVIALVTLLVAFIVIFSIIGGSSGELRASADSITDANNCSDGTDTTGTTLGYNFTTKYCSNSTGNDLYVAGQYDLPLNALFSRSGVVLLIFMAAILIFLIGIGLHTFKKK